MSDIAIKVENLGKSYLVGHNSAQSERYTALRDVIAHNAKNLARKTRDMFAGRPIVQGDEVEEFWALKDVNFEIKKGDRVGIIGRNGAGKSTLLKILSRITEPTTGRIQINGRIASLLEVGTGFHPELSGRENIFLNGAILGMSRQEIEGKFNEIVAFAEIDKFLDTPVKRYSSGMYVRLAFAVAAHLNTEILILDEVLAVGDARFQEKCFGKMEQVATDGKTVLFVSHNINAIEKFCNKAIYIKDGNIKYTGKTNEVINEYIRNGRYENEGKIIDSIKFQHNDISLFDIKINNSNDSDIYLNNEDNSLKVEVEFELNIDKDITLELIFKDSSDRILCVFLPGHLYGDKKLYRKGKNKITELIELPKNLNNGVYYLDIALTRPGVEYYTKAPMCATLHAPGISTAMGNTLTYESSGLISLTRSKLK